MNTITEELRDNLYSVYDLSERGFKNIKKFCINMNLLYLQNKYDKCVNRDDEINRACEIFLRKIKNNPILIGKAGVGKTAIVEGIVEKIIEYKIDEIANGTTNPLADKVILNVDLNSMIAGCKYRGDFEDRFDALINFLKDNSNVILFIDEIHMITDLNNNGDTGTVSMGQILKAPLSRGEITVIGATTEDEYEFIKNDKALDRRFSPVFIKEFTKTKMKSIIKTVSETYSNYHGLKIPTEILLTALDYCDKFYKNKTYPDKLIDIVDETAARLRFNNRTNETITVTIDDIRKTVFNQTGKLIVD